MILLRSFVRQELFRLCRQYDPQKANLKRGLTQVFEELEYGHTSAANSNSEYIFLARNSSSLRLDRPMIARDRLRQLVEDAFLQSTSRRQWCLRIFDLLNELQEVQNRLRNHELLSAAVAVNLQFMEFDCMRPSKLPNPEDDFDAETLNEARRKAVECIRETVIRDFVTKGRITEEVGARFAVAADKYLTDLSAHGNSDPIPDYFREVMPKEEHAQYLEKYKYVFETVINRAVEEFRSRLQ